MNRAICTAAGLALFVSLGAKDMAAEPAKLEPRNSRLITGVFTPDPEGIWRTITATDSTSNCIGDPVTPLCAIETHLACHQHHRLDLCRIAFEPFFEEGTYFAGDKPSSYFSYRVVRVRLAEVPDLEPRPGMVTTRQLGDHLIDVIIRICWASTGYCSTPQFPTTYAVRRFGNRWAVMDIHVPWH